MSTMHQCPGRCGRMVGYTHLACRECWFRLPGDLRVALNRAARARFATATGGAAHRAALQDCLKWYREEAAAQVIIEEVSEQ